jgi:hypothetical protein
VVAVVEAAEDSTVDEVLEAVWEVEVAVEDVLVDVKTVAVEEVAVEEVALAIQHPDNS